MYKFTLRYFLLSALLVLAACSRNPVEETSDEQSPVITLRATLVSGSETKTEIGASTTTGSYAQVVWKAGDQLKVFHSAGASRYVTEAGGATAEFTLAAEETVPEGASFMGLYPYSEDAAETSSNTITAQIPTEQTAVANSFDPNALLAVSASSKADQMAFYNVCSGIRFTLTQNEIAQYARIELKGNNNEAIAGAMTISAVGTSAPLATPAETGSSEVVTLSPLEGDAFAKDTYYYIAIRPCVFQEGFTMTFKDANGSEIFSRKCNSYVEFKRGIFATVRGVDDPARLPAIRDGELLSKNGTANCYIVSAPGYYKFPLSRAKETDILPDISEVNILWETDNSAGAQTKGSIIAEVVKNANFVYFSTPGTLKDGNAVIAAYNAKKEIVWSWHIWACNGYDPAATKQTYTGKNAAMMDRNLGALSNSATSPLSNGLFYQWGRKDPFPGAVESYVYNPTGGQLMSFTSKMQVEATETATVEYAIAHPLTFISTSRNNGNWLEVPDHALWTSTKTTYDPCPPGWKVPAAFVLNASKQHVTEEEAWTGLEYLRVASGASYGVYLDGNKAWYPNNGYLTVSGSLLMVGQYACYWSCSPNSQATYAMEQSQSTSGLTFNPSCYGKIRGEGHSVRCVEDN